MSLFIIITTVQEPTQCVIRWIESTQIYKATIVIVGDKKGPETYNLEGIHFLSYKNQLDIGFSIAKKLPFNHYARKNIGYLYAMRKGASYIYETDDDNEPTSIWRPRKEWIESVETINPSQRWINIYHYFTDDIIWPRGLPLDEIYTALPKTSLSDKPVKSPVQQGIVNGSPDVDAIWHLILNKKFLFSQQYNGRSILLGRGNWCPFNTQSTWWWPDAYPLLYIPSCCSIRICDIWKSLIAQRCLWEIDTGVVFHSPEVEQKRNPHDFIADFRDEVSGYIGNKYFASILNGVELLPGPKNVSKNLLTCYEALINAKIFPNEEIELVHAWIDDIASISNEK
jgi:hypothetical protein